MLVYTVLINHIYTVLFMTSIQPKHWPLCKSINPNHDIHSTCTQTIVSISQHKQYICYQQSINQTQTIIIIIIISHYGKHKRHQLGDTISQVKRGETPKENRAPKPKRTRQKHSKTKSYKTTIRNKKLKAYLWAN